MKNKRPHPSCFFASIAVLLFLAACLKSKRFL